MIIKDFSIQETSTKNPILLEFFNSKHKTLLKEDKKELPQEICHLFNKKSPYYLLKSTVYVNNSLITIKNSLGNISLTTKASCDKKITDHYSDIKSFFALIKIIEDKKRNDHTKKNSSYLSNKLNASIKKAKQILQRPEESSINVVSFLLKMRELYNKSQQIHLLKFNETKQHIPTQSVENEIATIKNHLPLINKMEQYFHYILNDSELLKINKSISYLMEKSKKLSKKLNLEIDNIENSYATTLCQLIIKKIEDLQQNNTHLQNTIKNYNQISYNNRYLYSNQDERKISKIFSFFEEIGSFLNNCVEKNNNLIKLSGFENKVDEDGLITYRENVLYLFSLLQKIKFLENTINHHSKALKESKKLLIQWLHRTNTQKTINTDSNAIILSECLNIIRYKTTKEQRLNLLTLNEVTLRSNQIMAKIIKKQTEELQQQWLTNFNYYNFPEFSLLNEKTKKLWYLANSVKLIQDCLLTKEENK